MTFVVTDVENVIRSWAETLTNVPFFHANDNTSRQSGLAPNGLYGTVRLIDAVMEGLPSETFTDIDVAGEPKSSHDLMTKYQATISINAYRTGARNTLNNLQIAAYSNTSSQILQLAEIGLVRFSLFRDLTEVINGNFEERSQMDLDINVVGAYNEELFIIETVPLENVTYNQNFEVSE